MNCFLILLLALCSNQNHGRSGCGCPYYQREYDTCPCHQDNISIHHQSFLRDNRDCECEKDRGEESCHLCTSMK